MYSIFFRNERPIETCLQYWATCRFMKKSFVTVSKWQTTDFRTNARKKLNYLRKKKRWAGWKNLKFTEFFEIFLELTSSETLLLIWEVWEFFSSIMSITQLLGQYCLDIRKFWRKLHISSKFSSKTAKTSGRNVISLKFLVRCRGNLNVREIAYTDRHRTVHNVNIMTIYF